MNNEYSQLASVTSVLLCVHDLFLFCHFSLPKKKRIVILLIMMNKLTKEDCFFAIEHGEFAEEVCGKSPKTAIILTQSWCPQWVAMYRYLDEAEKKAKEASIDFSIFFIEYDKESWAEDFISFKEDGFKNREIPYVRYYQDGKITGESNFISLGGFLKKAGVSS
jgi:glutaredoxin